MIEWVFEHSRSKNGARLTLLAIADACHNADGTGAWPSMAELLRKTGLKSDRSVQSATAELVKLGELWVGLNQGPNGCNRYAVLMTPAESAPPQILPPANSAPPADIAGAQDLEFPQVTPQDPADIAGGQYLPSPAESAPGTVSTTTTELLRSSSSSTAAPTEDAAAEKKPRKRQPKPEAPRREDAERLCDYLADAIEANGSLRPTVTDRWRDAARLMIDADGRTEDQIRRAIDWCQADTFWRTNILSMIKLREKYDQLRLAASRPGANGGNGLANGSAVPLSRNMQILAEARARLDAEEAEQRRTADTNARTIQGEFSWSNATP